MWPRILTSTGAYLKKHWKQFLLGLPLLFWHVAKSLVEDRVIGSINSFIDAHLGLLALLVKWIINSPLWVLVFVLIAIIGHAYWHEHSKARTQSKPEPSTDIPPTDDKPKQLVFQRPRIVPTRYARKEEKVAHGLFVRNDGDPAFDISVMDVKVGGSTLKFTGELTSLTKEHGDAFFEASIEQSQGAGIDGKALFEEMRRQNIEAIDVRIKYKDGDLRPFYTAVKLERDVGQKGGLMVRYMGQELPPTQAAPELTRNAPTRDWNTEWKECADRFKDINPFLRADWSQHEYRDEKEAWQIGGAIGGQDFASLANLCGEMLLASPMVRQNLPSSVGSEPNAANRWLAFLKYRGEMRQQNVVHEVMDDGRRFAIRIGSISGVADVSRRACIDCAAFEFRSMHPKGKGQGR